MVYTVYVTTIPQRHRETDGQTTSYRSNTALCVASRSKNRQQETVYVPLLTTWSTCTEATKSHTFCVC